MTHFADLSDYQYLQRETGESATRNIGWLDAEHPFATREPEPTFLERLWQFCGVWVASTRGLHSCELCDEDSNYTEYAGEKTLLGSAEIRVFSTTGGVFAAPNLIFHYVRQHSYLPPDEFVSAVMDGPRPPNPEFFADLGRLGLEWCHKRAAESRPEWFKVVMTEDGLKRVKVVRGGPKG
jgi:hypothetical protein